MFIAIHIKSRFTNLQQKHEQMLVICVNKCFITIDICLKLIAYKCVGSALDWSTGMQQHGASIEYVNSYVHKPGYKMLEVSGV